MHESPMNTNTNTPECGKRTQSLNPNKAKAFKTTTDGEEILAKNWRRWTRLNTREGTYQSM